MKIFARLLEGEQLKCIFFLYAADISKKTKYLKSIMISFETLIFSVQETHLRKKYFVFTSTFNYF